MSKMETDRHEKRNRLVLNRINISLLVHTKLWLLILIIRVYDFFTL